MLTKMFESFKDAFSVWYWTNLESRIGAKAAYKRYLQSARWDEKRQATRRRDGYKCRKCGSFANLETHHVTYIRKYNEAPSDLLTLCSECHHWEHFEVPISEVFKIPKPFRSK